MLSKKSPSPSFSHHDSLFTSLVVIWPYEINRPSSLLLRPHRGEGEEEEAGGETHSRSHNYLGRLHLFFFLFFIFFPFCFVYFSIGKGVMMWGGERHFRIPLQAPAGEVGLNESGAPGR